MKVLSLFYYTENEKTYKSYAKRKKTTKNTLRGKLVKIASTTGNFLKLSRIYFFLAC